jgi:hypothetical protein
VWGDGVMGKWGDGKWEVGIMNYEL